MRKRQYLYLYESFRVTIAESELGAGKTLTAKFCASAAGDPSAIGSSTKTATASGGNYTITYTRTELQSALGTMNRRDVWLHLDDGTAWRAVYGYNVTDTDPDTLPALVD